MMNEPQECDPYQLRNTVLQLHSNDLQAELIRMRCDLMLQHNVWREQQQQALHDNQLLLLALFYAGVVNASTSAQLKKSVHDGQCDPLTQMLNRNIMQDRIHQAISLAKRQHTAFALLFIDLDNFKPVNDQFGHSAGDAVLQQVSCRLKTAIRDSDAVSRHGGDEFLLLLNNTKHQRDATVFANKLCQLLAQPYQLPQGTAQLSASIGIARFPADGDCAQALISYADAAMYRVKQAAAVNTL